MNVYDICKNGIWKRQIVAHSTKEAELWVDRYMPGCSVSFSHRLS